MTIPNLISYNVSKQNGSNNGNSAPQQNSTPNGNQAVNQQRTLPQGKELSYVIAKHAPSAPIIQVSDPSIVISNNSLPLTELSLDKNIEILTPQEIEKQKESVKQNPIHQLIMNELENYKPALVNLLEENKKDIGYLTHSLTQFKSESFIRLPTAQELDSCGENSPEREYYKRLINIAKKYDEEFQKLCHERDRFSDEIVTLIKEQRNCRLFVETEALFRISRVHEKFNYLFAQLRQNACAAATILFNEFFKDDKKKRKSLDSTATVFLEQWFHAHLPEPYPSETEKQTLMLRTGLSLVQLNNWFGNKRIRYKKKITTKTIIKK